MALTEAQKRRIVEEERHRAQIRETADLIRGDQKYGVPALLSFFIPGLGQMVKGQVGKGILILIGTIIGYCLFVIPGLIMHIWAIADAYNKKP